MNTTLEVSHSHSRLAPALAVGWLALAVLIGASGKFALLPFPVPQVIVLALTIVTVWAGTRVAAVRAWVDALPLRALVAVHAVRFVGIAFLVLAAQGQLSPIFAEPAAWGDILAAAGALALLASGLPRTRGHRNLYLVWNTFGLLDFVVVVTTAAWVASRGLVPGMTPLLHLPLSLLPTFLVPLLIASHIFLFRRLRALEVK